GSTATVLALSADLSPTAGGWANAAAPPPAQGRRPTAASSGVPPAAPLPRAAPQTPAPRPVPRAWTRQPRRPTPRTSPGQATAASRARRRLWSLPPGRRVHAGTATSHGRAP